MPFSHQCQVCDKTLEAESISDLADSIEDHLLDHLESKIELDEKFLEDLDMEGSRNIAESTLGGSSDSLLEEMDSEDSTEDTGMNFADYETMTEDSYAEEDEQYGEERYMIDDMDSMANN